jgi:biopolymer transport protein ExbD
MKEVEGDMTPMIDCVFQLIIFFILLPFKQNEGKIDSHLPTDMGFISTSPPPPEPPKDVRIYLKGEAGQPVRVAVHEELLATLDTPPRLWDEIDSDERKAQMNAWRMRITEVFDQVALKVQPHLADPTIKVVIDAEPDVPVIYIVKAQDAARMAARRTPGRGGTVEINFTAPPPGVAEPERLGVSPMELLGTRAGSRAGGG